MGYNVIAGVFCHHDHPLIIQASMLSSTYGVSPADVTHLLQITTQYASYHTNISVFIDSDLVVKSSTSAFSPFQCISHIRASAVSGGIVSADLSFKISFIGYGGAMMMLPQNSEAMTELHSLDEIHLIITQSRPAPAPAPLATAMSMMNPVYNANAIKLVPTASAGKSLIMHFVSF
jgi:hypothetical protein